MAEAMCQVGCKAVALLDVRKEEGDETSLELIKKYGTNVKFYQIDVTDDEKVTKIMLTVCPLHFSHFRARFLTSHRLMRSLVVLTFFSAQLVLPSKFFSPAYNEPRLIVILLAPICQPNLTTPKSFVT